FARELQRNKKIILYRGRKRCTRCTDTLLGGQMPNPVLAAWFLPGRKPPPRPAGKSRIHTEFVGLVWSDLGRPRGAPRWAVGERARWVVPAYASAARWHRWRRVALGANPEAEDDRVVSAARKRGVAEVAALMTEVER
ncbi:MAG: hypothetical protein AABZ47_13855, partial [Planctomycetota bacterium]